MKSLWRHYSIWLPILSKFPGWKISFLPIWDKGFITTLAYYWSKETLNGNVTLGWLFIGPIWMHWMHCFKFTGGKNTLFLKCQHFLIFEELFSFFFFRNYFLSVFSFLSSLLLPAPPLCVWLHKEHTYLETFHWILESQLK